MGCPGQYERSGLRLRKYTKGKKEVNERIEGWGKRKFPYFGFSRKNQDKYDYNTVLEKGNQVRK
jgi:uncharacterized protein (UPF0128 family)